LVHRGRTCLFRSALWPRRFRSWRHRSNRFLRDFRLFHLAQLRSKAIERGIHRRPCDPHHAGSAGGLADFSIYPGPLLTAFPLSSYFASKSVWLYTLQNISIYRIMVSTLPGVFVHNPFPGFVNGSLWTLFFEVACYIGLFLAGIAGLLRRQQFVWMLLAWAVAYLGARYGPWAKLTYFAILSFPFVIGMTVYHFRAARILNGWIALALMATAVALGLAHHGVEELWSAATAYGVLCLGFTPAPALLAYNKAGDFSYGTYIYGHPGNRGSLVDCPVPSGLDPVRRSFLEICGEASSRASQNRGSTAARACQSRLR
jgi:hypothetical protein